MGMPSLPTPPLQLVGRAPEYVAFCAAAWMNAGRDSDAMAHVPRAVYDHHHHAQLERLWNDPGCTFLFAAHPPDPNFVFGYLIGEATNAGPVLHWLHVRRSMRGFGVARALLAAFLQGQVPLEHRRAPAWYSQGNPTWRRLVDAAQSEPWTRWAWQYNPFLLWEPYTLRGRP
jgi:GNAT superfamily N-acetyltransferase